jgi:hypothetical protein
LIEIIRIERRRNRKEKRRKSESDQTILEKSSDQKKGRGIPFKSSVEEGRFFEQPTAEGLEESEFGIAWDW